MSQTKANLGCVPKVAIGKSAGIHQPICGGFLLSSADFGYGSVSGGILAMECNHNDFKAHFYHTVTSKITVFLLVVSPVTASRDLAYVASSAITSS